MKKELSGPIVGIVIALVAVMAVGIGWYFLHREETPVYLPQLNQGGRKDRMPGAKGAPPPDKALPSSGKQ